MRSRSSAAMPVHARQLLRDALDRGTDALVVVGGDGVISLALQELAGGDVPLGHHPGRHRQRPRPRVPACPPVTPRPPPTSSPTADVQTVDLGRIVGGDGTAEMVRHRGRNGFRFTGQRPRQPDAVAARPDALQPGDDRGALQAAAAAVPVVVRRGRAAGHRIDDGCDRQHEKLRRRHADLPRRRPDRRPTRRHDDHLGVTHPAGPAVPHRVQGHARRPRHRVDHGAPRPSRSSARASTPTPTAISPVCCPPRSPPFPAPCGC